VTCAVPTVRVVSARGSLTTLPVMRCVAQ
jgi:hypothetical protein